MRTAIYARYSSAQQHETSLTDQIRLCAERASREGWTVVATYSDREISAATPMARRPGGRKMLAAAGAEFDVLVIEALDRCWRDIVDQERTIRRLEFAAIRIVGASDGYDSRHEDRELQRGVRGLLNQQYLRDLAKKTHRGQDGQVLRGYHAGGLAYGYRSVRAGEDGSRLIVHEPEAEWVRWIYERYGLERWSVQRIAFALNERGAPSPRGRSWAVSALYGSPAKGTGILNNAAYIGRVTWNRSRWVKDPESGSRTRLERPEREWRQIERPELRIVSDALWTAARARMGAPRHLGGRGKGARPSTLFGGLLRCGTCGGAMVAINGDLYGCAARKDRGPEICAGTTAPRRATDQRLLSVLRESLTGPEALAAIQTKVREMLSARERERRASTALAERRRSELDGEIRRLVDAIAAVGVSQSLQERLQAAEREKALLPRPGAGVQPAAQIAAVTGVLQRYREMLLRIDEPLKAAPAESRAVLAELFGPIAVRREGEEVWAEFAEPAQAVLLSAAGGESLDGVAGVGFCTHQPRRIRIK